MREWDNQISRLLKKKTRKAVSIPTAVLYAPADMMGLGLHRLSNAVMCERTTLAIKYLNAWRLDNGATAARMHPEYDWGQTIRKWLKGMNLQIGHNNQSEWGEHLQGTFWHHDDWMSERQIIGKDSQSGMLRYKSWIRRSRWIEMVANQDAERQSMNKETFAQSQAIRVRQEGKRIKVAPPEQKEHQVMEPNRRPEWAEELIGLIQQIEGNRTIYTDGSLRRTQAPLFSAFLPKREDPMHTRGTAAVLWTDDAEGPMTVEQASCRLMVGLVIKAHPDQFAECSSTALEALAILAALRVQYEMNECLEPTTIFTDSKASCDTWNKIASQQTPAQSQSAGAIWEQLRRLRRSRDSKGHLVKLEWLKAHPERRDPSQNSWSAAEFGNYAADQLTSLGVVSLGRLLGSVTVDYHELLEWVCSWR